jgi:hypothetical protein
MAGHDKLSQRVCKEKNTTFVENFGTTKQLPQKVLIR